LEDLIFRFNTNLADIPNLGKNNLKEIQEFLLDRGLIIYIDRERRQIIENLPDELTNFGTDTHNALKSAETEEESAEQTEDAEDDWFLFDVYKFEQRAHIITTEFEIEASEEDLKEDIERYNPTSVDAPHISKTAYIEYTEGDRKIIKEADLRFYLTKLYSYTKSYTEGTIHVRFLTEQEFRESQSKVDKPDDSHMTKHQFDVFTRLFTTVVEMCDSEDRLQDFLVNNSDATFIDKQDASKTARIEFADGKHQTTKKVTLKFDLAKSFATTFENITARILPV